MEGGGEEHQGAGTVACKDAVSLAAEAGSGAGRDHFVEVVVVIDLALEKAREGGVSAGGAAVAN